MVAPSPTGSIPDFSNITGSNNNDAADDDDDDGDAVDAFDEADHAGLLK